MKHNRIKTSGKNALKNAIHHTKNGIHTIKSHTDRLSENTKTRIKNAIAAGTLATVVTFGGYQIHEAIFEHDTITDVQKNADRKTQVFTESEYFLNLIHSRAYINASLTRDKMAFIDRANGKTIRIDTLPGNWDHLSSQERQQWRDAIRGEISAEYDIPGNEDNIAANTPRTNLESHTDTLLNITLRNLSKPTVHDPSLSRTEFIEASFAHLTGNRAADTFFQSHILGLVGNESQGDNGKVSQAKAIGIFQLMPHMITNATVNPKGYDIKSVALSLKKQAELAKNLILADYTLVNRYTDRIAEAYFDGNTDKAQEFFIAPLTFNAYNTGIPNIRRTLEPFLEKFPDKESIDAYLNSEHNDGLGMDVFYAYTLFASDYAAEHNSRKKKTEKTIGYGKDSSEYVLKALAMSAALRHHRENTLSELTPKAYTPNDVSFSVISWLRSDSRENKE